MKEEIHPVTDQAVPFGPTGQPAWCGSCETEAGADHWAWGKDSRYRLGGRWRCRAKKRADGARSRSRRRADPVRGEELRAYEREYAKRNAHWVRAKAYRHEDLRRGRASITWAEAQPLMEQPCHYCHLAPAGGLDRIDNELGHEVNNVVPCCMTCNTVLGDLPVGVKDLLADGLRASREGGLLDTWIIPQLRR